MKNIIRKIRIIFDIENWLWKSEISIFQSPPAKRTLICQKNFLWKSAIFHSIKLPFDAEVAKKSWTVFTVYLPMSDCADVQKLIMETLCTKSKLLYDKVFQLSQ